MRILSIDPGYERLGIAIIEKEKSGKERLIFSECFKTSSKKDFYLRLGEIGVEIESVIKKYGPEFLAIESLFFKNNQKTAMKVSEVRGTIIYICIKNDLKIKEFTPLEIKMAITSDGRGDKNQIINMIPKLIHLEKEIKHDDEYDAIAIGLTFFATHRNQ